MELDGEALVVDDVEGEGFEVTELGDDDREGDGRLFAPEEDEGGGGGYPVGEGGHGGGRGGGRRGGDVPQLDDVRDGGDVVRGCDSLPGGEAEEDGGGVVGGGGERELTNEGVGFATTHEEAHVLALETVECLDAGGICRGGRLEALLTDVEDFAGDFSDIVFFLLGDEGDNGVPLASHLAFPLDHGEVGVDTFLEGGAQAEAIVGNGFGVGGRRFLARGAGGEGGFGGGHVAYAGKKAVRGEADGDAPVFPGGREGEGRSRVGLGARDDPDGLHGPLAGGPGDIRTDAQLLLGITSERAGDEVGVLKGDDDVVRDAGKGVGDGNGGGDFPFLLGIRVPGEGEEEGEDNG